MKKTTSVIISFILILTMISSSAIVNAVSTSTLKNGVAQTTASEKKAKKKISKKKKLKKFKKKIKAYNKRIYKNGQRKLGGSKKKAQKVVERPSFNVKKYGIKSGIYGRVKISKINVNMPIYLGCNKTTMAKGAAHVSYTSIPYGGKNTTSVISAHNGWGSKAYFRDLSKLKKGNKVKITTPFNKLTYIVKKTKVIHSKKMNEMLIKSKKDRLILFTCKGGEGTKNRTVVFCERKKHK